jgi:CRISPR-associated exonuclease Cas4
MLAALLLLLALTLILAALALRRRSGLPWARVVYDDSGRRDLARPLFAPRYGLTGKPDYLIERAGELLPVEVKPGRRAQVPYESDVMQLAAYCLLLEETSGRAPRYGLLRYAEATFRIDFTPALRAELLATLEAMRGDLDAADCDRDHDEPRRCRGCGFFTVCAQALD